MKHAARCLFTAFALAAALVVPARPLFADDWPMLGRDHTRNAVSPEKNPPLDWDVKTGRNIKWRATVGRTCFAAPVVANGLVWIGTNGDGGGGRLMCFRESDGKFLYQHVSPPEPAPTRVWGWFGINCSPLVEGHRMWFTTTLAEILCLDIGPLHQSSGTAQELWKLDQMKDFGVSPAPFMMGGGQLCSIGASHGDLIYVITANGRRRDEHQWPVRAPQAPDLVCLNKNTGKVIWQDNSPGNNIIYGEFGHPVVIEVNGRAQVVAPQGDGWIRSFDALTGELIWKFDFNPKEIPHSSNDFGDETYLVFVNHTDRDVRLFWVDKKGASLN